VGVFAFLGINPYTDSMSLEDRVDRISELMDRVLEQEEKYESFLNASPWGILVTDKTFRIVYINRTLERMTGYSINELMGKHIKVLMEKSVAKTHAKHEQEYVKNIRAREGNHGRHPKILSKSGTLIPVEISFAPTKVQGQTFFFASIRDIESLFNTLDGQEK
jgi:PAS domain S-box-containing protein